MLFKERGVVECVEDDAPLVLRAFGVPEKIRPQIEAFRKLVCEKRLGISEIPDALTELVRLGAEASPNTISPTVFLESISRQQ
jgi:hypothetical protein